MTFTQQCNGCRFWIADTTSDAFDEEPHAYGQCRRFPPTISDHMASISIGTPNFGEQYDPEDMADSIAVHRASLSPVTFCNDWCGEFSYSGEHDADPADCPFVVQEGVGA
jgi:hypothetical protein